MKLSEIKNPSLRQRIIDEDRKQNPNRVGTVPATKCKSKSVSPLDGGHETSKGGKTGVGYVITLIAFRRRLCDPDNNVASFKATIDAIASSLGIIDGPGGAVWQYHQIQTTGEVGVLVKIEHPAGE